MTKGQERAFHELERLHLVDPQGFELIGKPSLVDGWLEAVISLRLGPMKMVEGGLNLKEREEFILRVPPDFPFEKPSLKVTHDRFTGFPHVIWSRYICLYQTKSEWNPSDGLYGFFDRLLIWLSRAAANDMDPIEGPLEPPHHNTDFSQPPFVIRANIPVQPGTAWIGLAELSKHPNRIELVNWNDMSGEWPTGRLPALAVVLPKALPMEFPVFGKDFFVELLKQGLDKERVLKVLRVATELTPENSPAYIIIALPMRRSPSGKVKQHVAVWSIDAENAQRLRTVSPSTQDHAEVSTIKAELNELIYKIFELSKISWCRVMEDRGEILVRRDIGSPVSWFAGKKVLVLGCGALGSWAAEIVARANPNLVHLVDDSIVKPGILARQNYILDDIGARKAPALANRLQAIISRDKIQAFIREAHSFIMEDTNRFVSYDVVLDCTASDIFQMKLERDWEAFDGRNPAIISVVINGKAQHCLSVAIGTGSDGGIWDAYVQLKHRLCLDQANKEIITAFYSEDASKDFFQPEPGCSDPTFSGSTADVSSLIATALNHSVKYIVDKKPIGIIYSAHKKNGNPGIVKVIKLSGIPSVSVGNYRVRIDKYVYREVKAWVKQNRRIRSSDHETGGILWGLWDDAIGVIWVFDVSGPPSDSLHDPAHFVCGVKGTIEEHKRRVEISHHACGYVGFWHTHPDMLPRQSIIDFANMSILVSRFGQNQKRALMLIFGRKRKNGVTGIYVYENKTMQGSRDIVSVDATEIQLEDLVV